MAPCSFAETLGDAARLNDEDCFGVVERHQGLEVAGVVGLAEGRVNVFRRVTTLSEGNTVVHGEFFVARGVPVEKVVGHRGPLFKRS